MVAMQKLWVYRLAIAAAGALVVAALLAVFGLHPVIFAGCAVMGLQPLGRRLFRVGAVGATDERDGDIERKAIVSGYTAFWLVFTLLFVALPFANGTIDTSMKVPGMLLPVVPMAGWWILEVTQSLSALMLYRRT